MTLAQRMRALQTKLLAIRLGSGAVILPKDVKRIHLRFAQKINGGHRGGRHFWRHELVRLKYHNPAVPMTVDRHLDPAGPSLLSIHFTSSPNAPQTSSSATSSPAAASDSTTSSTTPSDTDPTERVETIDIKFKQNDEILRELMQVTKAYHVEPTAEEREEMALLEEQRKKSERDSKISAEVRARVQREKELLEQARGEIATQAN